MIQNSLSILTVLDVSSIGLVYSLSLDSRLLVLFRPTNLWTLCGRYNSCYTSESLVPSRPRCMYVCAMDLPSIYNVRNRGKTLGWHLQSTLFIFSCLFRPSFAQQGVLDVHPALKKQKIQDIQPGNEHPCVLQLIGMMVSCYCGTFMNTGECSRVCCSQCLLQLCQPIIA